MRSAITYLNQLRQDNLIIEWLLERFNLELTDVGINSMKDKNLIGEDFNFLLELVRVYDDPKTFDARNFCKAPLSTLLLYLRKTHTFYLDKKLTEIQCKLDHWVNTESKIHVELLRSFFYSYRIKLKDHIDKEEGILFPYVDALLQLQNGKELDRNKLFQNKISLIQFLLEHDHEIEDDLTKFTWLLKKYESQFSDNLAFRTLVLQIEAFEIDLSIHATIEEEVLVPLAEDLEKKVLSKVFG